MPRPGARLANSAPSCTSTKQVSDATYAAARDRFGEQGVIDLIAVSGYYVAVAMTLNVAQVPLPPGVPVPLHPV